MNRERDEESWGRYLMFLLLVWSAQTSVLIDKHLKGACLPCRLVEVTIAAYALNCNTELVHNQHDMIIF